MPASGRANAVIATDDGPRAVVSVRQTLELCVTGSRQNASTATTAKGPILAPEHQSQ